MNEQQERAIAQGLRAGEPEAWRAFYDAYSERAWRSVARIAGPNRADIADILQESFLAAARSARNYDHRRGTLWAWLAGILRNQIALHFRKQRRQQRIDEPTVGTEVRPPPDILEKAETAMLVRKALSSLNDDYGALLAAKYLDDETVANIAQQEQSSIEAVRSKLARARRAFRETFDRLTSDISVSPSGQTDDR